MARSPTRPRQNRPATGMRPGARFSLVRFFAEVFGELRRVTWPTRQEATRLTVLVLVVSTAFGIFLGLADMVFADLFSRLTRN